MPCHIEIKFPLGHHTHTCICTPSCYSHPLRCFISCMRAHTHSAKSNFLLILLSFWSLIHDYVEFNFVPSSSIHPSIHSYMLALLLISSSSSPKNSQRNLRMYIFAWKTLRLIDRIGRAMWKISDARVSEVINNSTMFFWWWNKIKERKKRKKGKSEWTWSGKRYRTFFLLQSSYSIFFIHSFSWLK